MTLTSEINENQKARRRHRVAQETVLRGERSLGVALRSISESTLKTTEMHQGGALPSNPTCVWSINFRPVISMES